MVGALDSEFVALQEALRGEYSLEREIGRGGMGIVYLARDVALDRPVAIKVLPPALASNQDIRARFLREARTAAQLSHPNIVPIHRADERAGFAFFVMAFVDGETLGERIRRTGALTPKQAAKILREVAWALAYANGRGIVHRDVKPDNILLERDTGRALVSDFGIAQPMDSTMTGAGLVLGSAHFMSPEQAAGERLDGRSDLYSLGVVAHFALTGTLPIQGENAQQIMAKHITQEPQPLEVPAAPPGLVTAVKRAMAKRPDDRFATGEEFANALSAADTATAVVPIPIRAWLRPSTASIVLVLAISAALVFTIYRRTLATNPTEAWPLLMLFAVLLGGIVRHTRAALAAGFTMDDLRAALGEDIASRAEERRYVEAAGRKRSDAPDWMLTTPETATSSGKPRLNIGRFLTFGVTVGIVLVIMLQWVPRQYSGLVILLLMIPSMVELATGGADLDTGAPSRSFRLWRDRSASIDIDDIVKTGVGGWIDHFRMFFWRSWAGAAIGAIARLGIKHHVDPSSARPTEEVLGLAVTGLLDALPKDTRRRFARAREITQRLEQETASLRMKGDQPQRLAIVVAALENVRLDLLKLHAGQSSAESLEQALKAAEELGRDVNRAIAASAEAERLLIRSP